MVRFLWRSLQLAAVIVMVFVLQSLYPITDSLMLNSSQIFQRPWTLLTSIFLHGSLQHLAYNLLSLVIFGLVVENIAGTKRFFMIFFSSGIAASIAASLLYPASMGASGAVFGLIGFLAVIRPKLMVPAFGIPLPVIAAAALWVAVSFAALSYPGETAHAAHIGGLVFGALLGYFLREDYAEKKTKARVLTEDEIDEWEEEYMKK